MREGGREGTRAKPDNQLVYHKLTVYIKSRYQTNLFRSCCFGDQHHKY